MTTQKTFAIAQFARTHNIDPKRARAALRRAFKNDAKRVPHVRDDENARVAHTFNASWTFDMRDEQRVARIIMNDTQFARYNAKRAKSSDAKNAPASDAPDAS